MAEMTNVQLWKTVIRNVNFHLILRPNILVKAGVCVEATANNNGRSFRSKPKALVSSGRLKGLKVASDPLIEQAAPPSKYSASNCDFR